MGFLGERVVNDGRNPMRWDCTTQGCFNKVKRPKIEEFAECFPGRINFGDVDGIVEINSYVLMLEWKPEAIELQKGQALMYKRITGAGSKFTVLVVAGNAETMEVIAMMVYHNGTFYGWRPATLDTVKQRIRGWVSHAQTGFGKQREE
jgi:hypothetical protein